MCSLKPLCAAGAGRIILAGVHVWRSEAPMAPLGPTTGRPGAPYIFGAVGLIRSQAPERGSGTSRNTAVTFRLVSE